jgi:hypothetical protein
MPQYDGPGLQLLRKSAMASTGCQAKKFTANGRLHYREARALLCAGREIKNYPAWSQRFM